MLQRYLLESTHRAGIFRQATGLHGSGSRRPFHAPQIPQNARAFSDLTEKSKIDTQFESSIVRNMGMKLGLVRVAENVSMSYALSFRNSIHSGKKAEVEEGRTLRPIDHVQEFLQERGNGADELPPLNQPQVSGFTPRPMDYYGRGSFQERGNGVNQRPPLYQPQFPGFTPKPMEYGQGLFQGRRDGVNERPPLYQPQVGSTPRPMDYLQERGNGISGRPIQGSVESNADIVHIKLMRNNAFVTVTDSKGNKKIGVSAGKLSGKGGKLGRYAGEAAAEDIGRRVRQMKTRSVVVKVNGFTFFRRKKESILSFKEGYSNARGDMNPVVYIEDTTRKPHNGCRLRKKRRI